MDNLNHRILRFLYYYPNSKAKDIAKALKAEKRRVNQVLYKKLKGIVVKNNLCEWSVQCPKIRAQLADMLKDQPTHNKLKEPCPKRLARTYKKALNKHMERLDIALVLFAQGKLKVNHIEFLEKVEKGLMKMEKQLIKANINF